MRQADLRDDDELMALMEARLEEDFRTRTRISDWKNWPNSWAPRRRLIDLFRRSPIHKTATDYLDYMRLLRSLYYLQSKPQWGIAACAQEAGFTVIRTYNRKFQDALGMTPHDFRELIEAGREQGKQQDIWQKVR